MLNRRAGRKQWSYSLDCKQIECQLKARHSYEQQSGLATYALSSVSCLHQPWATAWGFFDTEIRNSAHLSLNPSTLGRSIAPLSRLPSRITSPLFRNQRSPRI